MSSSLYSSSSSAQGHQRTLHHSGYDVLERSSCLMLVGEGSFFSLVAKGHILQDLSKSPHHSLLLSFTSISAGASKWLFMLFLSSKKKSTWVTRWQEISSWLFIILYFSCILLCNGVDHSSVAFLSTILALLVWVSLNWWLTPAAYFTQGSVSKQDPKWSLLSCTLVWGFKKQKAT